ncbi:MAG: 3-isopropylmalate dehydratase small subunit [Sphingobium sp.]
MRPFTSLTAVAAPLPMSNIDTDQILAGRFLKTIARTGLGSKLFWSLRQNPDFVLNREPWTDAAILVSCENFGCGSSREHAPWALLDFGIRCVMAESIADIFHNNCIKSGILPIVLPKSEIDRLLGLASDPSMASMSIDLEKQCIETADGRSISFEIYPALKHALMQGIDDIGRSMEREDSISSFEVGYRSRRPWIANIPRRPAEMSKVCN